MHFKTTTKAFSLAFVALSINLANAQTATLEEVVITAEKREQSFQDVSLSVDVKTGEELRNTGRVSMEDILKDIPNVSVGDTGGGGNTINIRGIGSDLPPGFSGQSVSTNFDGSSSPLTQTSIFGFFDVDRVEVVKGPQGTIYGGNSTGGVVNVVSARPKFDETGGYASLEIADYNKKKLEAAANIPISDTLAARISGTAITQDGYLKDLVGQRRNQTGLATRGQLLWAPSDTTTITLLANYSRVDGNLWGNVSKENYDAGIFDEMFNDRGNAEPEASLNKSIREITKVQLNVETEIGPGILNVIPSWENTEELQSSLNNNGDLQYDARSPDAETTNLEIRFSSDADADVQWITGLYYSDLDQPGKPRTGPWLNGNWMGPPPAEGSDPDQRDTKSTAAFGQVTYPFTDSLRAILGGRYTKEETSYVNDRFANPTGELSENFFDWKLGIEKDFGDDILTYATLATAHKPGGYDDQGSEKFLAEESKSFELGLKSRWLDQTLQANGALFWYSYDNYQVVDFYFNAGTPTFLFYNAPGAETFGAEMELTYLLGENTTIGGSVAYLNGEYSKEYITHPDPFGPGVDQNGKSIPHAPNWSYYLNAEHTFNLNNGATLKPRLSWRWVDEQYGGVQVVPGNLMPSYDVLDFTLVYDTDNWGLSFYVNNLTDEHPVTSVGDPNGSPRYTLAAPRTTGLVLNVNF